MYDLIIIGSGPAGLSAAVYGKRAGFDILVMEKNSMSGGQVLNTHEVDNYLGLPGMNGFDMGMEFRRHAEKMGAVFKSAQVMGVEKAENGSFIIITDEEADDGTVINPPNDASGRNDANATGVSIGANAQNVKSGENIINDASVINKPCNKYETKSVIIATGASHALLGVPGEEAFAGRGVSYCATCDGAFFRNKTVAVVGGGDVAVEDAIFLSRICEKVYLIHRRDSLRAAKSLQERLFGCSNVELIWDSAVEEIRGGEQVEEVKLHYIKEDRREVKRVDGVFIAVGLKPNSGEFGGIAACDAGGYIIAGEECITQTPGIFAAGDVRTKSLRQIITAVADGANAVASAEKYLLRK